MMQMSLKTLLALVLAVISQIVSCDDLQSPETSVDWLPVNGISTSTQTLWWVKHTDTWYTVYQTFQIDLMPGLDFADGSEVMWWFCM